MASLIVPGQAFAQGQSDRLGQKLGTSPVQAAPPIKNPSKSADDASMNVPVTLRAGQSISLRTGAAIFAATQQSPPVSFIIGRKPSCGAVRETSQGVVLQTTG